MINIIFLFILFSSYPRTSSDQIDLSKNINHPSQPAILDSVSYQYPQTAEEWRARIDSMWGEGLPTEDKLAIFDTVWTTIDKRFACFINLDISWDSLRARYRPEIEQGVSAGRFAAIMNYMALNLKETHTWFDNFDINYNTFPDPTVPLLYCGGLGWDSHFGASLTPLPDSSLLVYNCVDNHPLSLEAGDRVLGYNGIPWKDLYKLLLKYELPIGSQGVWGANKITYEHTWLQSAGINWHLFETIDIYKYITGDTVHLPTILLQDKEMELPFYPEQLPVTGVPLPTGENKHNLSWGIVENSNIGYIYVWSWYYPEISNQFFNAIDSLVNVYHSDGLIFDFRFNTGGYVESSNKGLRMLFDSTYVKLGLARRANDGNHYSMQPGGIQYTLIGDSASTFDRPIAVLTGPWGISAGDFVPYRFRSLRNVRFFGESTASAFASPTVFDPGYSGWDIRYVYYNGFVMVDDTSRVFLTHMQQDVDEPVWFTPDDVHNGEDSIVKAALNWINANINSIENQSEIHPLTFKLTQNYPNPFNPSTKISYTIPQAGNVNLKIYNTLGQEVETLVNSYQNRGEYSINFNAQNLSSGLYFYRLHVDVKSLNQGQNYTETKKMLLVR